MSAAPRVSVVTIFLNEERFLAEAIDSVRAQTLEAWELILVDDGSTDGSVAIAERAAATDQRITYVTHPDRANRGMSASRNRGIASSRAPLIAFLDADDVWMPEKLAEQVAILDADPGIDMLYGRTLIWHSWNASDGRKDFCHDLGVEPGRAYVAPQLFPILVHNRAQTPTTVNAMMRRALVDRVGGFEDEFRGMFEDQVFFAKTHLTATCHVDGRTWARYRQHPSSSTAQSANARGDAGARAHFLDWLERYVRTHGHFTGEVPRSLRRARRDLFVQRGRAWIGAAVGRR